MPSIITDGEIPANVLEKFDAEALPTVIAGLNASAVRVAPCLVAADVAQAKVDEAKLILLGAITRWSQAGTGAFQQQTAGPFSVTSDTRQRAGFRLWPSEINDLQAICRGADDGKAFSVDTLPSGTVHAEVCALTFGAAYCSCMADIAGFPLYEE